MSPLLPPVILPASPPRRGAPPSLLGVRAGAMGSDVAGEVIFQEIGIQGLNGRLMLDT